MNRFFTLVNQFGLIRALPLCAFEISRFVFNRFAIHSYSQTGEDRIVDYYLGSSKTGFYVDVGCNHPRKASNTFRLYMKGWCGVVIDANQQLINEFRNERRNDVAVQALVSDSPAEKVFYHFEEPLLSSADSAHIERYQAEGRKVRRKETILPQTLTSILSEKGVPRQFDLLSIDVEGFDLSVLRSLDLRRWQPRLIVCEVHGLDLNNPTTNPVVSWLLGNGYALVGYVCENGYFLCSYEGRS